MNIDLPKIKARLPRPPKNLSRREILSLIGAAIVLLAIPLTVILFRRYQDSRIKAFENAEIVGGTVKITNIHAHGFTVSWATRGASTGVVQWGPAGQALVQTAYDDRAAGNGSFSSSTHHVTLPYPPGDDRTHDLFNTPEQPFDLKILSGDNKLYGGTFDNLFNVVDVSPTAAPIHITTGPELSTGLSDGSLSSAVLTSDQNIAAITRTNRTTSPAQTFEFSSVKVATKTIFLPLFAKKATLAPFENFSSVLQVQNPSETPANITLHFYTLTGAEEGEEVGDPNDPSQNLTIPAHGFRQRWWKDDLPRLPDGFLGSVVINSDQDIAAMTNVKRESEQGEELALETAGYRGFITSEAAKTYYLPLFARNYEDYNSHIFVQNTGSTRTYITAQFYNPNGEMLGHIGSYAPPKCSLIITPAGFTGEDPVPDNFLGSVVVESHDGISYPGQNVNGEDVVVSVFNTNTEPEVSFDYRGFNPNAVATTQYSPLFAKGFHDHFSTIYLQNTSRALNASVTAKFYDAEGNLVGSQTNLVPHEASLVIDAAGLSNSIVPNGFLGTAVLESGGEGGEIAAVIKTTNMSNFETGGFGSIEHKDTGTKLYVPLYSNNFHDQISSTQVQNTSGQPTNICFYAYDAEGREVYSECVPVAAHGFHQFYAPSLDRCTEPLPDVAPGCPDPVYGDVQKSGGVAAPGAIVYTTVRNSEGVSSAPLSTVTNNEGRYTIDLGNARTRDRSAYFSYARNSASYWEDLSAQGGVDGVAKLIGNPTNNDEPIPTLTLDNQGPTIVHDPVTTAPENQDITIEATITDPSGVASIGFCHRRSDDGMWGCVGFPFTGGLFSTHILASVVTRAGVDYYITAVDNPGNSSSHPEGAPPAFHHITVVPAADTTPPAAVTDLTVTEETTNSITLTWTAPGDDGNTGTASEYDVRYSDSPITDADWDNIAEAPFEPTPQPAGATETFTIHTLTSGMTYYFALKTADEVPNWSSLSNVAMGTTGTNLVCTNAVAPKTFEIAPGETQELTASPTGGSGNYTYSWSATGGSFEGSTTSSTTTWKSPAAATNGQTFTITANITDTETQETCSDSATATISVPGPELHHVNITPTSATLTVGETQSFGAQAYDVDDNPITSGVTYSWSVEGAIGSVSPNTSQTTTFTATTAGTGAVKVTATLGADSVSKNAPVTVYTALSCTNSVSPKAFEIAPNGTRALTATPTGGSGNYTYSWSATGGSFEGSTTSSTTTWKSPAAATNGQTFSITATVTDTETQETCSDSATATIVIPAAPTLNISLLMQGRKSYPGDSRGSSGTVDIFARRPGETTKLWEVDDSTIAADGTASNISLTGLSSGESYEFLLKGYIHLQVKKPLTLSSSNTLNFGTLPTGDLNSTRDNQVNSLDNDIVLTGWQQTWNSPQACKDNYADCKLADFNLDSKVNSIDHDYIFSNWGKNGDK